MADYIGYMTNCIAIGDEFSDIGGTKVRNIIRFTLDGFLIELVQNPELIYLNSLTKVKGQNIVTSQLIFRNVSEADFDRIRHTIDIISEMLSFALESRVCFCGYDFPALGNWKQQLSTVGTIETFRPVFEKGDGAQIKRFVELCYNSYKTLRTPRSLNVVVDYLYQGALSALAIEVKLAVLFVLLEHLKHTFAISDGYPFVSGFFREKGATEASPGKKVSFKRLLTEMLNAVHMAADLGPIVDLRNELIHSGLSSLNTDDKWQKIEEIEGIVREYLLRLLNYTGEFFPFTNTGPRTI